MRGTVTLAENPPRTPELLSELTAVWLASVRATHTFLDEAQIQALLPAVGEALRGVETLVTARENGRSVGFLGIEGDRLEMLFLRPDHIGTGLGGRLLTKAIRDYPVRYVDVNEQNPRAAAVYRRYGFREYRRTALDGQGNPFPLLNMRLE